MNKKWSRVEAMMFLSLSFTVLLIGVRFIYLGKMQFHFFVWNLFLAVIPVLFSRTLHKNDKINFRVIVKLALWLLFLPNAPYIVTDLVHFTERPPVPRWYDLVMITSAAWNGLVLGIISLLQVEQFLLKHLSQLKVNVIIIATLFLSSFGVYLGRFLRFNSWDIITDPLDLTRFIAKQFLYPHHYTKTWVFTVLFGVLLSIVYYTIKNLPGMVKQLKVE
jgi:uncharacterized membrane protein